MAKIIWAPSALKDIDLIAEYISRDSIDRASLFIDRLFEVTDNLQSSPQLGRIIPEIGDENCRDHLWFI